MKDVVFRLWGPDMCFSRPESDIERITYQVITATAILGVMVAIYAKLRQFVWRVRKYEVLTEPKIMTMRFNELSAPPSLKNVDRFFVEEHRTQRYTQILKNQAYVIHAYPVIRGEPSTTNNVQKHIKIFNRRIQTGACFYRPCGGLSDFPVFFGEANPDEKPIAQTADLGPMPWYVEYNPKTNAWIRAQFYNAKLENGVVHVPEVPYVY